MASGNVGNINTFLELSQSMPQSSLPSAVLPPRLILGILQGRMEGIPMSELQRLTSPVLPDPFRELLTRLRDADYITVAGDTLNPTVKIAQKGEEYLSLA